MNKFITLFLFLPLLSFSQITISNRPLKGSAYFPIVDKTSSALIIYANTENVLVKKSTEFLAGDIERVTNIKPDISSSDRVENKNPIII